MCAMTNSDLIFFYEIKIQYGSHKCGKSACRCFFVCPKTTILCLLASLSLWKFPRLIELLCVFVSQNLAKLTAAVIVKYVADFVCIKIKTL